MSSPNLFAKLNGQTQKQVFMLPKRTFIRHQKPHDMQNQSYSSNLYEHFNSRSRYFVFGGKNINAQKNLQNKGYLQKDAVSKVNLYPNPELDFYRKPQDAQEVPCPYIRLQPNRRFMHRPNFIPRDLPDSIKMPRFDTLAHQNEVFHSTLPSSYYGIKNRDIVKDQRTITPEGIRKEDSYIKHSTSSFPGKSYPCFEQGLYFSHRKKDVNKQINSGENKDLQKRSDFTKEKQIIKSKKRKNSDCSTSSFTNRCNRRPQKRYSIDHSNRSNPDKTLNLSSSSISSSSNASYSFTDADFLFPRNKKGYTPLTTNVPRIVEGLDIKSRQRKYLFESCSEASRKMGINRTRMSRSKFYLLCIKLAMSLLHFRNYSVLTLKLTCILPACRAGGGEINEIFFQYVENKNQNESEHEEQVSKETNSSARSQQLLFVDESIKQCESKRENDQTVDPRIIEAASALLHL